ncbi:hypothetical protein BDL97_18G001200 [Sphagnum fallax]|nr:hypothetical protein BDL97_18G001200 [Sphagnum fallax]KAH8932853.1 hypothetical protein BDL97_18G001200 [Sphagnum fallax]KAH8932854.1 hypothetical protein BDL97_18G001200 [Sphagnum fallax]
MATSFEDLRRTVQSVVHKLASSENKESQFNARQCEFLQQKASEIVPILDHFEYTLRKHDLHSPQMSWDPPNWIPAAMELQRVLKDAEVLIQECNCDRDQWLQVEIKRGNLKETFARIIYDLEWHTFLLCGLFVPENSAFHPNWETCDGNLRLNESFILSAAAEWDRETLRESLTSSHICDGEICRADLGEKCLAKQVLDKLDAEEQVSGDPKNFRVLMRLFLWVKPEHLPKGKKLGKGGFATVRETEWLGQKFAQKMFSDGTAYNTSFKQEIAAMAGLDHPNIIHAVCCAEDNRRLSIVMELMYKSLYDLLHQDCTSPLSIFQAIDLMLQISEGLRYVHSKNIAHRDLKSLNILVRFADPQPEIRSDGMVNITTNTLFVAKVADFGLAKVKNTSTMRGRQTEDVGTTLWMAPETPHVDAMGWHLDRFHPMKLDVYSFGIICYEILSREDPFQGVMRTHLRSYVQAGNRPQLPDEIPGRLDILINNCWDGNPLYRPDFAAICTELRFIKLGLLSGGLNIANNIELNFKRGPIKHEQDRLSLCCLWL